MLIGIDVGPAAVTATSIEGDEVRAAVRIPIDESLTGGVGTAVRLLVAEDPRARDVPAVAVSTSRLEEAIVRAEGLASTGCVRLCVAARDSAPPLAGWPAPLADAIGRHAYQCRGGHEFDGTLPDPLDPEEFAAIAAALAADGIRTVAVTAAFSPVNSSAEFAAADLLRERLPGVLVSMSHEIGTIGLLERENATILNAALLPLAERLAAAIAGEVGAAAPRATVYLAQSDGTVMELSYGRRYPVLTLGAGSTSALRGAAILSGRADCLAVDIEPDAAELGLVRAGRPRQVIRTSTIGGVRTNLRGPETIRVPFAAGEPALAHDDDEPSGSGGERVGTGPASRVERAVATLDPYGTQPVVVVGVGHQDLPARPGVIRPPWGEVARAVGTAGTRIGSAVDCIVAGQPMAHARSLERAKLLASQRAVMAGARRETVRIAEIEETPLAYLPGDFVHLRVKATGDIA